jgi:hypothetical protein
MAMTLVDEPLSRTERSRRRRRRKARRRGAVVLAVVLVGGAVVLVWTTAQDASPRGHRSLATAASSRLSAGRPASSPAPITSTVPVTASAAAATLVRDIESGVAAGSIAPADGRSLIALVGAALAAAPPAPPAQALNAVASLSNAITSEVQAGTISAPSASTLSGHLDELAVALGVAPPGPGSGPVRP